MNIEWERKLHTSQNEVFFDPHRFKVLACGTRWGKTMLCAYIAASKGLKKKIDIWWVAPTYELGERGLAALFTIAPAEFFTKENKVRRILPMISGTEIQFKTAENPVSLLGKGIDLLIIDEASRIKDEIWYRYLRRTLIDHAGEAIFIATPHGRNWFYHLWLKGQDDLNDQYKSWHFETGDNPLINPEELKRAENDMPELIFRQECMAEFLEGANLVFRNIRACTTGDLCEPISGQTYTMGVDLAKHQDFTVITVLDFANHVVYFDRFNQLDWGFQKARIKNIAEKYHALVMLDSTGVGDPIFDDLSNAGVNVRGITFTTASKRALIENLSLLIDQRKITFPKIDQLIYELEGYECDMLPSGHIRYSAPSGLSDDCVDSIALAAWGCSRVITGVPVSVGQRETADVMRDF